MSPRHDAGGQSIAGVQVADHVKQQRKWNSSGGQPGNPQKRQNCWGGQPGNQRWRRSISGGRLWRAVPTFPCFYWRLNTGEVTRHFNGPGGKDLLAKVWVQAAPGPMRSGSGSSSGKAGPMGSGRSHSGKEAPTTCGCSGCPDDAGISGFSDNWAAHQGMQPPITIAALAAPGTTYELDTDRNKHRDETRQNEREPSRSKEEA